MWPLRTLNVLSLRLVQVHLLGSSLHRRAQAPLRWSGGTSHRARDCTFISCGSMHGRSKFTSIIGFGCSLDVGQQCERELWDTNDNAIHGHLCCVWLHQLHVDADLLAKVEGVIDHLKQLLQRVIHGRLVGPVNHYLHHIVEREVIDAFVVTAISRRPWQKRLCQKIHVLFWPFWWPCRCGNATRCTLPNGGGPWLLDATGCHHWVSICTLLTQRPPWSSILAKQIELWHCEIAVPKLVFKRHKTDPLLSSSKQQAA